MACMWAKPLLQSTAGEQINLSPLIWGFDGMLQAGFVLSQPKERGPTDYIFLSLTGDGPPIPFKAGFVSADTIEGALLEP